MEINCTYCRLSITHAWHEHIGHMECFGPGRGGSQLVLVTTLFALPAHSAATCSHEHVQWKPKAMFPQQGSRLLRGVATLQGSTESCYTICPTCVCALSEEYNCCARETASVYAGCVQGSELKLCPTHRAVNTCCRTGR
jgi:hypothetical protein